MMHPQLQLSQPGLIQGGGTGMANPDVFRRIIQAQLSAKDGSLVSIYSTIYSQHTNIDLFQLVVDIA